MDFNRTLMVSNKLFFSLLLLFPWHSAKTVANPAVRKTTKTFPIVTRLLLGTSYLRPEFFSKKFREQVDTCWNRTCRSRSTSKASPYTYTVWLNEISLNPKTLHFSFQRKFQRISVAKQVLSTYRSCKINIFRLYSRQSAL